MGKLKQLLPLADKIAVHHCIDTISAAGIEDITVVIGPEHEDIRRAVAGFPVRLAVNTEPGSEMAESVRTGLSAVAADCRGLLICLSDHPLVSADTIRMIVGAHVRKPDRIVIPSYHRRRGHPCLFPIDAAGKVFSGMNLRQIIAANPSLIEYVGVDDEGVVLDMDTEEDYRVMQERFQRILPGRQ